MQTENRTFDAVNVALYYATKLRNKHKYVGVVYCEASRKFFIDTFPGVKLGETETVILEFIKGRRAYGFASNEDIINEFLNN